MEQAPTLKFYTKWGIKGLKYSLISLLIIIPILLVITLMDYSFSEIMLLLIETPGKFLDIFLILQGLIVFIALPIVVAIIIGTKKKEKRLIQESKIA
jgi:uncharacterized Tic20 family protein